MSADLILRVGNLTVLPVWALLLVVPRWRGTQILAALLAPALIAAIYGVLLLSQLGVDSGGSFGSVVGVQRLFANPYVLVAGWYHYLAFDLVVGAWQTRDAMRIGLPIWLRAPALVLTLMFGPLGLLLYVVIAAWRGHARRWRHSSSPCALFPPATASYERRRRREGSWCACTGTARFAWPPSARSAAG